jgi:hypothetical protein
MRAAGGDVTLVAPSPSALEALKVSGFLRMQLFHTADTLAEISAAQAPEPPATAETLPHTHKLQSLPVGQGSPSSSQRDQPTVWSEMVRIVSRILFFWKR